MGKKVNPLIFRISNIKNPAIAWHAQWIAKKNQFAKYLQEDEMIRKSIKSQTRDVGIDKVIIQVINAVIEGFFIFFKKILFIG